MYYNSNRGMYLNHSHQYVDKKLDRMPYAQAGIIRDNDGNVYLKSYETIVIKIDRDGWMEVTGLYSATTRKHIGAFMNEITNGRLGYYFAKQCYTDGVTMNIYTGEAKAA